MKKLTAFLSIPLAFTLVMTGCGTADKNESAQNGGNTPTAQNSYEKIKAAGELTIGTEGTYAPFTFHDASGKLTGFDVEIAEEVTKRIGVKPKFVEATWDGLLAGLDADRFHAVVNEVSITPERQQKYDFSSPYIVSKAVLITHKDNTDIKTFADLKGKKSAQSLTSNLTEIAKENGAEIVGTEGFNQAIDLLSTKRVDATINDGLSFLDLKKQKPDVPLKIVAEHGNASKSGIVFKKGNQELVDAVNKALKGMQDDGTYLKISEKYFGADVSK